MNLNNIRRDPDFEGAEIKCLKWFSDVKMSCNFFYIILKI